MNIFFSGIGGVGIGPLAEIAHDAGYGVVGSDIEESLMTRQLQGEGINVCIGQDGTFLLACHRDQPIDWFVYTSALPDSHPELGLARQLGIRIAKRDELLAHIIKEKGLKLIGVAGTHGKTTTTSMLIWAFKELGIPASYSVGTTLKFGPSGKYDENSQYFIYECDEFDRNFLHFSPYLALITSIDYDHPDTYASPADYLDAFHKFVTNSQRVIAWENQPIEVFKNLENKITFLKSDDIKPGLVLNGDVYKQNATLAIRGLENIGIQGDLVKILNNYPGSDRRMEKLADGLYSDYGHHPTEIAATLQLAHELSDDIVLVYQPHQNIRQYQIHDQYTNQFELAKNIYWLPTYLSREDSDLPILKPDDLIKNITNKDKIKIVDFDDNLWKIIQKAREDGKLVLAMGAGKIDSWIRERLKTTDSRS